MSPKHPKHPNTPPAPPAHRWSRRAVLKALGFGAAAALLNPFFSQLARADTTPPRRFVFVVEGNCFEPVTMLSDGARAAIDATASAPLGLSLIHI